MNILLTTHLYKTPDRIDLRGDADALHDFAAEWVRMGHRVTVLHAYMHNYTGFSRVKLLLPSMKLERAALDGVQILRVEMRLVKALDSVRRMFMRRAARIFAKELGDEKPDIILAHFPVITAGLPESLPYPCSRVGVLHTTDISRLRSASIWPGYNCLGFRSKRIQDDFHAIAQWDKPEFLVYSGAPEVPEQSDRVREPNGIFKLLYAGKLIRRKNVDLVLRALSQLPAEIEWLFTIVGDGPERARLVGLIGDLNLGNRVALTGTLPREEVLRLMGEQDVFVMPSVGETLGLVYLEAMAQRMVAIGTRGEGIDGIIVDGENGYLVEPNVDALVTLIERIARLPNEEREQIEENAVRTAREMNAPAMAAQYLENATRLSGETI